MVSNLFNQRLHMNFLQSAGVQLEAKIFAREGQTSPRERLEYMVEIYFFTPDWVNGAFFKICDEASYVTKQFQNVFGCLQLILIRVDEDCRIINI